MATASTGHLRKLAGQRYAARVRIDDQGTRRTFALTGIAAGDEAAALERCNDMARIAENVRRAGFASKVEELMKIAGRVRPGRPWESVVLAAEQLCSGAGLRPIEAKPITTVKALGEQWRNGELHEKHPDIVRKKKHAWRDEIIARKYVDPVIGHINVAEVTLSDCEDVMAQIAARHVADEQRKAREHARRREDAGRPPKRRPPVSPPAPRTRRHVAQYVRRLLEMAVYPCRLRPTNPIPRGWLPRVRTEKAKEFLYPSEDRKLLACTAIPLVRRLAYGMLYREGMRTDELARTTWAAIGLDVGRIDLDENKTDDPRAWALDPGVTRALAAWKKIAPAPRKRRGKPDDRVFVLDTDHLAERLRDDLKLAGVTRAKLFERTESRLPLRAHDLRASFVTWALACGRTETWVSDRTGHRSSAMIQRYRRKARTWTELELGTLDPLDQAIPELRELVSDAPMGESLATSTEAAARASGDVPEGLEVPELEPASAQVSVAVEEPDVVPASTSTEASDDAFARSPEDAARALARDEAATASTEAARAPRAPAAAAASTEAARAPRAPAAAAASTEAARAPRDVVSPAPSVGSAGPERAKLRRSPSILVDAAAESASRVESCGRESHNENAEEPVFQGASAWVRRRGLEPLRLATLEPEAPAFPSGNDLHERSQGEETKAEVAASQSAVDSSGPTSGPLRARSTLPEAADDGPPVPRGSADDGPSVPRGSAGDGPSIPQGAGGELAAVAAMLRIAVTLASGDLRVLLTTASERLDRLAGPSAEVISVHTRRRER